MDFYCISVEVSGFLRIFANKKERMKGIVLYIFVVVCSLAAQAQVTDAFQGILPVTDHTMMKSLNGEWSVKVIKGVTDETAVPAKDQTWKKIPVPGCWEAYGLCEPTYHHADPLTGYYHTSFTVPKAWKGQQIVLRFDGVLYGYDLWINDKYVGSWRSAYNTALFDITPFLNRKSERQELAMRVISQFRGSDFDYNDDWQPSGIVRDVTLMAVPKTHVKDLTIHTKNDGTVDVKTEIANADRHTSIRHEILDAQDKIVGRNKVESPHLWTSETPYLYTLRTTLTKKGKTLQTFEHKFGFRELTIEGSLLKLNGQPIKLRGVTSHSTDPKTVKVIDEASILRDMKLMKEASINYIRTSHYPREPRFYELTDSLGFYVIDEVSFGYGDNNLYDSTYYEVLQQRAQATIRRDKNHPSVLIWSLGNENPLTDICIRLGDYVKKELDASRPICYPQIGNYFRQFSYKFPKIADIYTPHYPTTSQVADFYQRADRPVIFTEYLHSLGISFEDHDRQWELIERALCIAGGSVWEWVDQGMPFRGKKEDVRRKKYGYEEKVYTSVDGGFEMNGNQGTDGLLYADRTPLPNYFELQHNYAQAAVVDTVFTGILHIRNRYDFIDLKDHVTLYWQLTDGQQTLAQGAFSPACAPHQSVEYPLALPELPAGKLLLLNIDIKNRQGWTLLRQSLKVQDAPAIVSASKASIQEMIQQGPLVRVGRKETMAERMNIKDVRITRYLQPLQNPYAQAEVSMEGNKVDYLLTPDTTRRFLSELGVAYLLDKHIDRVQWLGYGPYASYPGRQKANRYGVWALHQDDLYFEGNRMGIDAAWFSDKDGNGILITGQNLNINFEQTDLGIVVTVNAAVSGQGPKFAQTAFGVWSNEIGTQTGSFQLMRTETGQLLTPFASPANIPAAFKPYLTQYDTYLMKFEDITVSNRIE